MNKKEIRIAFEEFENIDDLPEKEQQLINRAREAAKHAYAPYSRFYVGASVLLEDGTIIIGNNQENAAYPSGLCAERVALFAASSQYPGIAVKTLVITARSSDFNINSPVSPCGGCRQVIAEYENLHGKPIRIILTGESGAIHVFSGIGDLLPLSFDANQLQKKSR